MGVTVLPSLKPSVQGLTLNFDHIWDCHHPKVRYSNLYASYFAHGLTSNAALLHLAQLVWSQGFEVSRPIVNKLPEAEKISFACIPVSWSADGVVCCHLLTCFQLGEDGKSSSSWEILASHQMWPIR